MSGFLAYWARHADDLVEAAFEHAALVAVVLVLSVALASVISLALARHRLAETVGVGALSTLYSIPSLALFALLIPLTGLGATTAVVVMVAYNQFLLVRNFVAGLNGIDAGIVEAARGMGMDERMLLRRVRLPLAIPSIMAGIRLAAISTVGIATVAATINAGGLGSLLFSGLRTMNLDLIVGASLAAVAVALAFDLALRAVEHAIAPRGI